MLDERQPPALAQTPDVSRRYAMRVLATSALVGYLPPIGLFQAGRPFGASATLDELAVWQRDDPEQIVLPFDLRYNAAFKLARIEQEKPEIIWISSSRAGTFRAALFAPYRFYNLSFTAWTTGQMAELFERATKRHRPRIAILSLDHFLFADRWEEWFAITRKMHYDGPLTYMRASLLDFARTATRHSAVFRDYLSAPTHFVGTQSIFHQEGFRDDGSYVYSTGHLADARSRFLNAQTLAETLPRASGLSSRLMQPIVRIAEIARARDVKLIGVQLPFIRAGVDMLDREQDGLFGFGTWREFATEATRTWLHATGIPMFDLGRLPMEDETISFVDAYHPSEGGAARVMLQLLKSPDFRNQFPRTDPVRIELGMPATARQ